MTHVITYVLFCYFHAAAPVEQAFEPASKTSAWWAFEGWQDNQLPDGQIADNALSVLKELKVNQTERGEERPFFWRSDFTNL